MAARQLNNSEGLKDLLDVAGYDDRFLYKEFVCRYGVGPVVQETAACSLMVAKPNPSA